MTVSSCSCLCVIEIVGETVWDLSFQHAVLSHLYFTENWAPNTSQQESFVPNLAGLFFLPENEYLYIHISEP